MKKVAIFVLYRVRELMKKLIPIAVSILLLLLFSQGIWLYEFIQKERTTYRTLLQKELMQSVNFHATECYGIENSQNYDKGGFVIEDAPDSKIRDNKALAVYHLDTKSDKQDKASFSDLVYKTFTELALVKKEFRLQRVDSLFREDFSDVEQIATYKIYLLKKEDKIDSLSFNECSSQDTLLIKIPLGTEKIYHLEGSFQLKKSAFVKNLIGSVSISAFAIILVALFIIWQIIALQRSKQKLEWKQKVVAGIVHDLKSPLAHTYTVLDFFAQTEQDTFKKQQLLIAGNKVKTLSARIAYILSVFKTQESTIQLQLKPYALFEKCSLLIEEMSKTYQNKTLSIKLFIPKDLRINADEFYFDTVLRNLIENAVKYSAEKAFVTISTEITDKKLYVHVADKGQGIDSEEQKRIFKEYYRVRNVAAKGHGIGLSFTKMIVKKHKGNITLKSELGTGSTFTLSFPKTLLL